MKRSEINALLREAKAFFADHRFHLPDWGHWSPERWAEVGDEAAEVIENHLGWDITDFGTGDFARCGLLLFTLRNGNLAKEGELKPYAEKIMIVREGQLTPRHFHFQKMEDIINRGGGKLVIELYNSDEHEDLADSEVTVRIDGIFRRVPAGGQVILAPGQSICLTPYLYHAFWGEPGGGLVLVGEVSSVNDDLHDNRFHENLGRFPAIAEDEPALHLLCTEYRGYFQRAAQPAAQAPAVGQGN